MRIKYIALLFIVSCSASKINAPVEDVKINVTYTPYNFCFSAKNERFVSAYKVMRSKSANSGFSLLVPFAPKYAPDSSIYCYQLPKSKIGYYYKVMAYMPNNVYATTPVYLKSTIK